MSCPLDTLANIAALTANSPIESLSSLRSMKDMMQRIPPLSESPPCVDIAATDAPKSSVGNKKVSSNSSASKGKKTVKKTVKKKPVKLAKKRASIAKKTRKNNRKNKKAAKKKTTSSKKAISSASKQLSQTAATSATKPKSKTSTSTHHNQPSFPTILMGILSAPQNADYITFLSDLQRIIIIHPDAVATKVLPMHFDPTSDCTNGACCGGVQEGGGGVPTYKEFLNLFKKWGFEVMTDPLYPQVNVYRHEMFRKGDWEGCLKMTLPKVDNHQDQEEGGGSMSHEEEMDESRHSYASSGVAHQPQQKPALNNKVSSGSSHASHSSRRMPFKNNCPSAPMEARSVTPPEMNVMPPPPPYQGMHQQHPYHQGSNSMPSQYQPNTPEAFSSAWMTSQSRSMLEQQRMMESRRRRCLSPGNNMYSSSFMEEMMMDEMMKRMQNHRRPEWMDRMMHYRTSCNNQGREGPSYNNNNMNMRAGTMNNMDNNGGFGSISLNYYSSNLQQSLARQVSGAPNNMNMKHMMMRPRNTTTTTEVARMSDAQVQSITQDVVSKAVATLQRGERQQQEQQMLQIQVQQQERHSRDMTEELLGQLRRTIDNSVPPPSSSGGNNTSTSSSSTSFTRSSSSTLDAMTEAFLERSNARRMRSRPVGIYGSGI